MNSNLIISQVVLRFISIIKLIYGSENEILCGSDQSAGELRIIGLPTQGQVKDDENVFVLPKGSQPFSITCISEKPVNWTFSGVMSNSKVQIERFRNHEANCHYMQIHFHYLAEEQTGIYTCYEISRVWKNQTFTLFAGRETAFLRYRGRTIDIVQGMDDPYVYFPCSLNDPNVTVFLMRKKSQDEDEWEMVDDSIEFDPILGFKVKLDPKSSISSGTFKCETGLTDADRVYFNYKLIEVDFRPKADTIIFPPAEATHQFECRSTKHPVELRMTSSSAKAYRYVKLNKKSKPKNKATATLTLTSAALSNSREISGSISCFALGNDSSISANQIWTWNFNVSEQNFTSGLKFDFEAGTATCTSSAPGSLQFYRIFCELLTSCAFKSPCLLNDEEWKCCGYLRRKPDIVSRNAISITVDLPPISGALRCFGVDVDETIYLHTDTRGKLRLDSDNTYNLGIRIIGNTEITEGGTIQAECFASERFYYDFLKYELGHDGQLREYVFKEEFVKDENKTELGLFKRKVEIRITRTDANQLRCFAENYEVHVGFIIWKNINVKGRMLPPVIYGSKSVAVDIFEDEPSSGSRNLSCEVEDFIQPKLKWTIPPSVAISDVFINETNFWPGEVKSVSELILPSRADKRFEGTYTCSAKNKYNISAREFHVNIISGSKIWLYVIMGIVVSAILIAMAVGLFIYIQRHTRSRGHRIVPCSQSQDSGNHLEMLHPNAQMYLEEFRRGRPDDGGSSGAFENTAFTSGDDHDGHYVAVLSVYDPQEFEIQPEWLAFERKDVLGSGAQGIVFKGLLQGGKFGTTPIPVAIKTIKPTAQCEYVKTLLTEVKVLIYLGGHPNIINLVGACTESTNISKLYLVTKYCSNGTLERYLRDRRNNFEDQINGGEKISQISQSYVFQCESKVSTVDLVNWAIQISNGMEYLATKKVIHGDLATRNILLDENLIVKISDFGLSKRLYQYTTQYVKQEQVAIPWRWMSIESLRDLHFSSSSDIWSFGVTIWEIFSLAEVPYHATAWSLEFLQQLVGGLRLLQPKYATEEIYSLMHKCWEENPMSRPKISEVKGCLLEIVKHFNTEPNGDKILQ